MRCVSVTLLLCLATMLLAQVTCQISGVSNCLCLKTSNRVLRKEEIESYMIQKAGVCHIDAILFKTVSGRFICANPLKPWVKRAVEFVDKKKAVETTARPINSASTSTLNNTSHTTG
ncbi:monocyte chemotactic protein 1B-like [Sinocyclocheilus anshuiensis]|uniref:Monocyte chemotactic protein 1B-like n=1 Tax=Sinocyclocheilus anshuiensis TaxID=1608454 RepID=A0A671MWK9_9TELE|nr:PREDICTED: monocyte chemotactic protein 1B-like [Sinocyclocheilus anshuiensis]